MEEHFSVTRKTGSSIAMDGETLLMRIDNAELNDTIGMCCEGVHHDTE